MFGILRKLSGESENKPEEDQLNSATPIEPDPKKGRRNRSGTKQDDDCQSLKENKRKRFSRTKGKLSSQTSSLSIEDGEIESSDDEEDVH